MRVLSRIIFFSLGVAVVIAAAWWWSRPERSASTAGAPARPHGTATPFNFGQLLPAIPLENPSQLEESRDALATPPSLIFVDTPTGKSRATVFIDGREAGRSPYMGQVRCDPDTPVVVELLFPDGARTRHSTVCSSEIRVMSND